jgi:hypothetical protein
MEVDRDLIRDAQRFITGANVHHVKTWIFCYETCIPGTARFFRYESLLRDFVSSQQALSIIRLHSQGNRQIAASKANSKRGGRSN